MSKLALGFVLFLTLMIPSKPGRAAGASFTVGHLHKHCRAYLKLIKRTSKKPLTKKQTVDIVKCNVFIAGFHFGKISTNMLNDTKGPYCLPNGDKVTSNWIIRRFVNWARRYPRYKAKAAGVGVMRSLQEQYGCDERDRVK